MAKTGKTAPAPVPELKAAPELDSGQLYRSKAFPFVRSGTVYAFGLREYLVEPAIAPGESAVCALAAVDAGLTYGITCGGRGRLFYFHPAFGVTHVGLLGEGAALGGALVDVGGNEVVGGWHGAGGGGLFRHATAAEAGQGLEQFTGRASPVGLVDLPPGEEGITALAYDATSGTVYGLTVPTGSLLALDCASGDLRTVARIQNAAPVLAVLPDGTVLGAQAEGQLWRYTPSARELAPLDAAAPCQKGKRHVAGVQSLVVSSSGMVFGGTSTDGFLFSYDPVNGTVLNHGKPSRQSNIRALVEGHEGRIYGVVEEPQGMAHLFIFDPAVHDFTDLGIVGASFPEHWIAHSIGSMSVGPFGEIFLGETDNISHVFIYYPPIPRQPGAGGPAVSAPRHAQMPS